MRRFLTLVALMTGALMAAALLPILAPAQAVQSGSAAPATAPYAAPTPSPSPTGASGGPVVLMGIDAEDGGPNAHGPTATYTRLVNNILAQATKPTGVEVVVIGCKPGTNTGSFWDLVFPGHRCVVGGAAILAETFQQAKLVAIVSDEYNTPFGGLTCNDEDQALDDTSTQTELAAHVNEGGGLLGFSSDCPRPYDYISGVAQIGVGINRGYADIDPTQEGLSVGIDDTLDVCCWHDVFLSFPNFLNVLAFEHGTQDAAAIGGRKVVVQPPVQVPTTLQLTPKRSENVVDTVHTVNALVQDQFGNNVQGAPVTFQVTGASGTIIEMHRTDKDGVATLQYQGPPLPGTDVIYACVDRDSNTACELTDQPSDVAEKTWILPASTPNCAVDLNKETGGGQIIAANGDLFSFGGNAQVGPKGDTRGEQQARDHGPREQFIYHGNVVAVICEAANPTTGTPGRATIFTVSSNAGSINQTARIDVQDVAEPGVGADTYRFRFTGFDTGEQTLKSGNIQIHR